MNMIVGLGNPGKKYENTRHNAGWIAIDLLLDKYGYTLMKNEFDAIVYTTNINGEKTLLVKPQTYMNNSGISVFKIKEYYKIEKSNILIIHDDKDFEVGKNQIKIGGSSAGHNGIKSIIQYLKGEDFKRFRVGVGKPEPNWLIVDWVLSQFKQEELALLKTNFLLKWNEYIK